MIDREARDEPPVEQIGIKGRQLLGEEHALVDDRAAGQRAEVEILDLLGDDALFDASADDVELELEGLLVEAAAVVDDDLLDLGPRRVRLLADEFDIERHLAPAMEGEAGIENFRLDNGAATLLPVEIGARQEDLANRELARPGGNPGDTKMGTEEILRDLDMDAGAIAGLAVGIDGAAMPHRLQRVDAGLDHVAPRLAVERCDKADAAGIVLLGRIVEPGGFELGRVGAEGFDEILGHAHSAAAFGTALASR